MPLNAHPVKGAEFLDASFLINQLQRSPDNFLFHFEFKVQFSHIVNHLFLIGKNIILITRHVPLVAAKIVPAKGKQNAKVLQFTC